MSSVLGVGVIGCGNISATYFRNVPIFKNIKVVACADINPLSSYDSSKEFGVTALSVEEILNDKDIDILVWGCKGYPGAQQKPKMYSWIYENENYNDINILFEGAQGISLDVDHGVYPFTTSSNTSAGHISTGAGITFRNINRVIGVVKAYLSRVGESPLPSEIIGKEGNSLREKGGEYGTTTGRPRRIGWLDLVQVRQAVRVNGLTEIALTKLDVLDELDEINLCIAYELSLIHI